MVKELSEEDYNRVTGALNGRLTTMGETPSAGVGEKSEPTAPSWWYGDEEASQSSMAAAMTMKRTR